MSSKLLAIVILLTGSNFGLLYAQDVPSFNIGIEAGCPSNTVYDLCQGKRGFIWVGTENGLARCNGKTFKTFEATGDVRSLAVSSIQEDGHGTSGWLTSPVRS